MLDFGSHSSTLPGSLRVAVYGWISQKNLTFLEQVRYGRYDVQVHLNADTVCRVLRDAVVGDGEQPPS